MTSSTNSAFRQALAAKDEEMRHAKEETQRYKLELAKVRKDHISEKEQLNTKLREMVNALELKGEAMAVERAALLHDQERWRNRSMKIASHNVRKAKLRNAFKIWLRIDNNSSVVILRLIQRDWNLIQIHKFWSFWKNLAHNKKANSYQIELEKNIKDLEAQVKQHQSEIYDWEQRYNKLNSEYQENIKDINELKNDMNKEKNKYLDIEIKYNNLMSEHSTLRNDYDLLQDLYSQELNKNTNFQIQIRELIESVESFRAMNEALSQKNTELISSSSAAAQAQSVLIAQLNQQLILSQNEINQLKSNQFDVVLKFESELFDLSNCLNIKTKELNEMISKLQDSRSLIATLESENRHLKKDSDSHASQYHHLKDKFDKIEIENNTNIQTIQSLQLENTNLQNIINELKLKISQLLKDASDSHQASLEQKMRFQTELTEKLALAARERFDDIHKYKQFNIEKDNEISIIKAKLRDMKSVFEAEIERLRATIVMHEHRIAELQQLLMQKDSEIYDFTLQNNQLVSELQQRKQENSLLLTNNHNLKNQISILLEIESKYNSLSMEHQNCGSEISIYISKVAQLEHRLSEFRFQQSTNNDLNNTIKQLNETIAVYDLKIKTLESELEVKNRNLGDNDILIKKLRLMIDEVDNREEYIKLNEDYNYLTLKNNDLNLEIQSLRSQLSAVNLEIGDLQTLLESNQTEIVLFENKIRRHLGEYQRLQQEYERYQRQTAEEISKLQEIIVSLNDRICNLETEVDELETMIAELELGEREANERARVADTLRIQSDSELSTMKSDKIKLLAKIKLMESDIQRLNQQIQVYESVQIDLRYKLEKQYKIKIENLMGLGDRENDKCDQQQQELTSDSLTDNNNTHNYEAFIDYLSHGDTDVYIKDVKVVGASSNHSSHHPSSIHSSSNHPLSNSLFSRSHSPLSSSDYRIYSPPPSTLNSLDVIANAQAILNFSKK